MVLYGEKQEDTGIAVRKAEKAMRTAKNKFYAANAELKDSRPAIWTSAVAGSGTSTFIPYLQPLYSIQYNRVYGAEVLVREIDPRLGNIHTPVEFIERHGARAHDLYGGKSRCCDKPAS